MIRKSEHIVIKNLKIEGPNLRITGEEATENREFFTGLNKGGCGGWSGDLNKRECSAKQNC